MCKAAYCWCLLPSVICMSLRVSVLVLCVKQSFTWVFPHIGSLLNIFNALIITPIAVYMGGIPEWPVHGLVDSDLTFNSLVAKLSVMLHVIWMSIIANINCVIHISDLSPCGNNSSVWDRITLKLPIDWRLVVLQKWHRVSSVDTIKTIFWFPALFYCFEASFVFKHSVSHYWGRSCKK